MFPSHLGFTFFGVTGSIVFGVVLLLFWLSLVV